MDADLFLEILAGPSATVSYLPANYQIPGQLYTYRFRGIGHMREPLGHDGKRDPSC